jgi:hypothetical protein
MAGGDNSISRISTVMKLVWWLYAYVLCIKFGGEFPRWREVAMDGRARESLSLARLAEVTAQAFKLATDWSPHRYVTARRIELARRLLLRDRQTASQLRTARVSLISITSAACSDSGSGCCRRRSQAAAFGPSVGPNRFQPQASDASAGFMCVHELRREIIGKGSRL